MILLLSCRQSPCCDITRFYRLLSVFFFSSRKRNSGELTFDLIQVPSSIIHLVVSKCPQVLIYFYFYIHTHFIEPPKIEGT